MGLSLSKWFGAIVGTALLSLGLVSAVALPESQLDQGTQTIGTLSVTSDGQALRSNFSNAVLLRLTNDFEDMGIDDPLRNAGGEYTMYPDYIWIEPGAISDGSILPEDIFGDIGTAPFGTGSCATGLVGIADDGTRECYDASTAQYRDNAGDNAIYTKADTSGGGAIEVTVERILVGDDNDAFVVDTSTGNPIIAVEGETRVTDGDINIVSETSAPVLSISSDSEVIGINRPTSAGEDRVIVLGPDSGDAVGVGTSSPDAALHVVGGSLTQGTRTLASEDSSSVMNRTHVDANTTMRKSNQPTTIRAVPGGSQGSVFGPLGDEQDVLGNAGLVDSVYAAELAGVSTINIQPNTLAAAPSFRNVISTTRTDIANLTWSIDNRSSPMYSLMGVMDPPFPDTNVSIGYDDTLSLPYNDIRYDLVEDSDRYACTIRLHNWGGVQMMQCDLIVTGCATPEAGTFCSGAITLSTVTGGDDTRVAVGISPRALGRDDFRGTLDVYPMISTSASQSSIDTDRGASLRLANLSPEQSDYMTLEEVGCKLLTVDPNGHMVLVDYQSYRCDGGGSTPVDGACGTAQGGTYVTTPSSNLCASGSPSVVTTPAWFDENYRWSCSGTNGGGSAQCTAYAPGQCGTAAGTTPVLLPTDDLCAVGPVSDFYNPYPDTDITPNIFTWVCNAESASPASCSVPGYPYDSLEGQCGNDAGGTFDTMGEIDEPCDGGVPTTITLENGVYTWQCLGENSSSPLCTANQSTIDGMCGDSDDATFDTMGDIDEPCEDGEPTAITIDGDEYQWQCLGSGSGTDDDCSAEVATTPTEGYAWDLGEWSSCFDSSGFCGGTPADVGSKIDRQGNPFDWDDGWVYNPTTVIETFCPQLIDADMSNGSTSDQPRIQPTATIVTACLTMAGDAFSSPYVYEISADGTRWNRHHISDGISPVNGYQGFQTYPSGVVYRTDYDFAPAYGGLEVSCDGTSQSACEGVNGCNWTSGTCDGSWDQTAPSCLSRYSNSWNVNFCSGTDQQSFRNSCYYYGYPIGSTPDDNGGNYVDPSVCSDVPSSDPATTCTTSNGDTLILACIWAPNPTTTTIQCSDSNPSNQNDCETQNSSSGACTWNSASTSIQTRTVACVDSSGFIVDDQECIDAGLTPDIDENNDGVPDEERPCPFTIVPDPNNAPGIVYRGFCQDDPSQDTSEAYTCQFDQGSWVATMPNIGCDPITHTSVPISGPGYNDPNALEDVICVEQ